MSQKGRVLNVSPAVRGQERRRLMDLGIIPGTIIEAEFQSPMSDPTAYRIRGALIALRREQADLISVVPLEENDL
jgi:Fe2+ transport system protein FeoA